MATFADEVDNCPVPLPHLDIIEFQPDQFGSAQSTAKQDGQHRIIPLGAKVWAVGSLQYPRTLICTQPIAGPKAKLLDALHASNTGGQFWAQQTGISGFVSQSAHGSKLLIDGVRCKTSRFEVHTIADDDNTIEGEPRFRAIPGNELINRIFVNATRGRGPEAVQDLQLGMV